MEWHAVRNSSDKKKDDELMHHGILGMKWGVRRYQNYDGSLTNAGRKRYGVEERKHPKDKAEGYTEIQGKALKTLEKYENDVLKYSDYNTQKGKDAAKLGAKALAKMGQVTEIDANDPDFQWQFLNEDWSDGLPQLAAMINAGKSPSYAKKAIRDIAKSMFELNDPDWDLDFADMYDIVNIASTKAGLEQFDKFIDACAEIKRNGK